MNEATRACIDCGADISHRHFNAKRCEPCARAESERYQRPLVKNPRGKLTTPRPYVDKVCIVCGETFSTNSNRSLACSVRCRQWKVGHPGEPLPIERVCLTCGKTISAEQGRRYCSRACSSAASKRRVRDIKSPYARHEICATCGGPMPGGVRAGRRYCSKPCGQRDKLVEHALMESIGTRACVACGKEFKPKSPRNVTCSRACSRQRDIELNSSNWNHKRRARLNASPDSVGVSPRDWARELRRVAGACFYCGVRSGKLTMDHVIPVSRGGRHALGNVAPACRRCNASKHDDTVMEWRRRIARCKATAA